MRVLWILCLLIGSITCVFSAPAVFMQQPSSSGYWYSGKVSSDPGSSSSQPSLPYPSSGFPAPKGVSSSAGPGSFSSYPYVYSGSNMAEGPVVQPGYPTFRDEGYSGGYGFVVAPGSATSDGAPDENQEAVFSDVLDLEPVYAFKARSRYQQGRLQFAQTRYIPGLPAFVPMPASEPISKGTSKQSAPFRGPPLFVG